VGHPPAFAAFQGNTTTVVVNGNAVALTPYQVGIFGGVYQQTYGFNKVVTCGSSIILPYLPAPNPDDLSATILDSGKGAAETAAGAAESAANKIKGAARIGPSRIARIAKLEQKANFASKAAKGLKVVGRAAATYEAYKNYKENCRN
jgi:hypothetical protein